MVRILSMNEENFLNKRLEDVIRKTFQLSESGIEENWTSVDIPKWDSVGHLNLIVEIEKTFQVTMEMDEMFEIETLGDIQKILKRKQAL